MRELSRKVIDIGRLVLSLVLLGILVTAVGGSAERLVVEVIGDNITAYMAQSGVAETACLSEAFEPEAAEPSDEGMADSKRRERPVSSCQITAAMFHKDKTDSRVRFDLDKQDVRESTIHATSPERPLLTSSGQVNSQLGHQFTLVGARPSGTS